MTLENYLCERFSIMRDRSADLTRGPHAFLLRDQAFIVRDRATALTRNSHAPPSRVVFIKPCKAAIGEHNLTVVFQAMPLGGGG